MNMDSITIAAMQAQNIGTSDPGDSQTKAMAIRAVIWFMRNSIAHRKDMQ